MNRLGILAGSAVALTLVVAGCAKTPPYATGPATAPAASPSPVVSVTPSAAPSSQSPSPTPSATQLVLAGTGIAGIPFGSAQSQVAKAVTGQLGEPDTTFQGETCEGLSGQWGETDTYGNLVVQYAAKTIKKTAPRTLVTWRIDLTKKLAKTVVVADSVPLNLSFTQLKAKYPAAKYVDLGMPDGTKALQLPNKLIFTGISKPDMLWGGEITSCE
jgi:hypothetical protein